MQKAERSDPIASFQPALRAHFTAVSAEQPQTPCGMSTKRIPGNERRITISEPLPGFTFRSCIAHQIDSGLSLLHLAEGSHNDNPGMSGLERGRRSVIVEELDRAAQSGLLLVRAGPGAPFDGEHSSVA